MDAYAGPVPVSPYVVQGLPLGTLLQMLRRNAPVIVALCVIGAIVGYSISRTQPQSFTATTVVALDADRLAIPELAGAVRREASPDPLPEVRTEMQALTSRDLVREVVVQMQLDKLPEFNADLRPPTLVGKIKGDLKALLPNSGAPSMPSDPLDGVIGAVSHNITVFQDDRSLAIQLSFTSYNPQLSATFANTLVSDYVAGRANRRESLNYSANTTITQRIGEVKQQISDTETKMQQLRDHDQVVLLRAGSVGQQELEDLTTALAKANVDRAQLQANYDRATALARSGNSGALALVLNSPTIGQLRTQESQASQKAAELSARYGSAYPPLRAAEAEVAIAQRQVGAETARIVSSLGTQLKAATDNVASLTSQLEQARQHAVQSENVRAQMDQLEADAKSERALYQTLVQSGQQTLGQPAADQTPALSVLSTAAPPANPSGPNNKMAAGLGGIGGAVLGCLFAVARTRQVKLGDVEGLAEEAGLVTVGSIPRRDLGRGAASLITARVVQAPGAAEATRLRELRGRIRHLGSTRSPRLLLISSALPNDDAAKLGLAVARLSVIDGERVLLVDANFAAPALNQLARLQCGDLAAVLTGSDWRDVVTVDNMTSLQMLAPTCPAADSATLLAGINFHNLLTDARQEYDLVVVCGPSADTSDAAVLADRTEATLVVLEAAGKRGATRDAARRLAIRRPHATAAVLVTR